MKPYLQAFATASFFLLACATYASDFIAEIDDIKADRNLIEIAGQQYTLEANALKGTAPNTRRSLRISDLSAGLPVKVTTRGQRIESLEVISADSDLPN